MTVKSYPNGEDAESIFDYLWIRVSDNHAEQLQKAWERAVLFRPALSDGGMILIVSLRHHPAPDSGHNSQKTGHNSNFSSISPT